MELIPEIDWQPISTIPLRTKIRIKTASGMVRIAKCPVKSPYCSKAHCFSADRKNVGDLIAVAWAPLDEAAA